MAEINVSTFCVNCGGELDSSLDVTAQSLGEISLEIDFCQECLKPYTKKVEKLVEILKQVKYEAFGVGEKYAVKVLAKITKIVTDFEADL